MSSIEKQQNSPAWWRSLEQLAGGPRFRAFLEGEFPSEASASEAGFAVGDGDGISRRRWLQVMGASLALGTAGGCRWEKQEILPFAERPEGRTPGSHQRFATAMPLGDSCIALEVTTVDGRPLRTHLALELAAVILCLEADPLGSHPATARHARDFAAGREKAKTRKGSG